jgi:hypothetical protein
MNKKDIIKKLDKIETDVALMKKQLSILNGTSDRKKTIELLNNVFSFIELAYDIEIDIYRFIKERQDEMCIRSKNTKRT